MTSPREQGESAIIPWRERCMALWRGHWREILGVFVILVAALALRLHGIGAEAPWADEINTLVTVQEEPTFRESLQRLRGWEGTNALIYPALAWFWGRWLASPDVLSMRMLSLIFGLASIVVTYFIGRRTGGVYAGMAAAAFLAVTQPHAYYSVEIRPYALLLFAAAVSSWAFLVLLSRPSPSIPWWTVHIAANFVVIWTHLLGWVLLVAQGLTLWTCYGRRIRLWLGWGVLQLPAVILLAVLWIRTMDWEVVERMAPPFEAPSLEHVAGGFRIFAGVFYPDALPEFVASLWAPALFAGATLAVYLAWRGRGEESKPLAAGGAPDVVALCYVLLWLLAPMAALLAISLTWTWMLSAHYMIHCVIAGAVLVGCGLAALPGPWIRGAAVCGVIGLGAYANLAFPGPTRTNYPAAFEHIAAEPVRSVPVYVQPHVYRLCSEYNWRLMEWPAFEPEFIPVEAKEDLLPAIHAHGFREGLAWVLLHHVEAGETADVSARLTEAGLTHDIYTPPGGLPRVTVYRIEEPTR